MTTVNIYNASTNPVQATPLTSSTSSTGSGMSFGDILDAVNPLQHIPVLSNLYRAATGSSISPGSQIAGDTIYGALLGGPVLAGAALGLAASSTDVAVQQTTGQGIAGHVLATLGIGASTSTTTAINATPLVPDSSAVSTAQVTASANQTQNNSVQAQAQNAAQLISHQGAHPERANIQYQRAQMHDAMNKYLTKIVI